MKKIKGKVPAAILLDRKNCYFLRTGRCSLDLVDAFGLNASVKVSPNELLFCPRLAEAMRRDKAHERTVAVTPCACGHAEVSVMPQKVCIASKLNMELSLVSTEKEPKALCVACGRQMTFDEEQPDHEGARLIDLRAIAQTE